jgi:carbonic anhydrase/acetyltransferase-like protein (isoleucine patch superfamily)
MLRPFRGRMPVVHPTAFVDDTAQIIGDVEIGAESSVWMHVVVRGDVHRIRIGDRSNVQDGTIVHAMKDQYATTIGDDVTIAHAAVIHGCTIRDRVLVGIGAIVLNGAEIGEDSIVAAGALVTERAIVPPRSLVMGRPGKVTRALTDAEVRTVLGYAERYVKYRLDYMASDETSSTCEVRSSKSD